MKGDEFLWVRTKLQKPKDSLRSMKLHAGKRGKKEKEAFSTREKRLKEGGEEQ